MTVSELIRHLQELEAQGHGEKPVVVYRGYDSEPELLDGGPTIEHRSDVWRMDGWTRRIEGEFLIFE